MRRKILIAAPFPPRRDGLHGGSQTLGRCVDELSDLHRLGVIYLRANDDAPMEPALAARCAAVEEVAWPGTVPSLRRPARLLWGWAQGQPLWAADWRVPAFRARFRQMIRTWEPDLVQFEFHIMAQYRDEAAALPSILVQHEPGVVGARGRLQLSRGWRREVLSRDLRAWEGYERQIHQEFNAVVCFTEADRRGILELCPDARVEVIAPRGTPVEARKPESGRGNTILFAGNFLHPPNVDAAIRLARGILPKVLARHPDAMLTLVGDAPPASVRRLAGPSIVVTGRVPELRPFIESAAVVATPLRLGGGLRVKALDALAFGKALISTRLGVGGLDVADEREVLIAETDEEFAHAINRLLANPELREQLGSRAHAWAVRFATPGRVARAFEQLYASCGCGA